MSASTAYVTGSLRFARSRREAAAIRFARSLAQPSR